MGRYVRRDPEGTILHKIIRENLETFLADVRSGDLHGRGLPWYVEQEFRDYLTRHSRNQRGCRGLQAPDPRLQVKPSAVPG